MKSDSSMIQNRLVALAIAAVFLVNLAGADAAIQTCDDNLDTDGDRLSDCLEQNILGTLSSRADTDGDGIRDDRDLAPLADDAVEIPVQLGIVSLSRLDTCEWRKGNRWDPYISTAFVKLPLTSGDVTKSFTKTGTGFQSRSSHTDERPSGPIETPPTVTINVPTDFSKIRVPSLGAFPFLELNVGLMEHDTGPSSADDTIRLMPNANVLVDKEVPIAVDTAGQSITLDYSGSGSNCDGRIGIEVNSPLEWVQMVKAVLASTKTSGQFVRVSDMQNAAGAGVCGAIVVTGLDDGTGGAATTRLCVSGAGAPPTASITTAINDELAASLDAPLALADGNDPDHPIGHTAGSIINVQMSHFHETTKLPADVSLLYGVVGAVPAGSWATTTVRVLDSEGNVVHESTSSGQDLEALAAGRWEALAPAETTWPAGSTITFAITAEDGTHMASGTLPNAPDPMHGLVHFGINLDTGTVAVTADWEDSSAFLADLG